MKKYGVIMAGGGGTRFWPLSRKKTPKQLLNLSGKDYMINETIDRLSFTIAKEDIFIVTNSEQVSSMIEVTRGRILQDHILAEPCARNTAACIGYAAMEITRKYGDGIMIVTPSDAYIRDTASFTRVLSEAVETAITQDKLITIGITPTFPATGYGYIQYNQTENGIAKSVTEFHEKPDEDTAKKYLKEGSYVWNSGMFIWKASTILDKYHELIPDIYSDLCVIGDSMGTAAEQETLEKTYSEIRKISVDYAIMEPSAAKGDVLVVPGEFGWNDVGSWDMMNVLNESDENGNILIGDTVAVETSNSTIYSSDKFVALVGIDNMVVVSTEDAVLVCPKDRAQDVKSIVEYLTDKNRLELL